jgi:tripartite-type tricarboxylate transporter receptor subunit TctC
MRSKAVSIIEGSGGLVMTTWKTTVAVTLMAAMGSSTAQAPPATTAAPPTSVAQTSVAQTSVAQTSVDRTWPDRVIKVVVPNTAGGPMDITGRIVTKRLSEVLGHPVIIENRPGASSLIGYRVVAAAEPDGYTLLIGNTTALAILPAIVRSASDFDGLKRLVPVAKLVEGYEVMVADPAGPATTLPAFVAYARARPGVLNYGSVGVGNLTHVAGEMLKQRTGIDMQHVPYRGTTDLIAGLLSGQVQMNFTEITGVVPLARQGKIRPLAIASPVRDPKAPDIPTFIEQGVPDFIVATFTGVMAPAGTPPAIVEKLNGAINAALTDPETRALLENLGTSVRPSTPDEFGAFLAAEQRKWEGVAKLAGLRG